MSVHLPSSPTVQVLLAIWRRLLGRSSIRNDEEFFSIGGTPELATQLFTEIGQAFGRRLPPESIYHAPTITALAALLENPGTLSCLPLVLLKQGTAPPVFLAHGLGGSVFQFFHLVKHIQTTHSIYAFQAKGMDAVHEPLDRIEDMAQFHLDAMKKCQPRGPYFLVGYSLGGLIVFEIARCLVETGENVPLLAMVDAYPHPRHLRTSQRASLIFQLLRRQASAISTWPPRQAFSSLLRHRDERRPNSRVRKQGVAHQIEASPTPTFERIRDSAARALANYRPKFYPGEIKFVRADIPSEFPADPAAIWANLAAQLAIQTVEGDHESMLKTHFASLGAVLSHYLQHLPCSE